MPTLNEQNFRKVLTGKLGPRQKQQLRQQIFGGKKPVITIGGTNGSGKTRLMEMLAHALDLETHQSSYRDLGKVKEIQRLAKNDPLVDYHIDAKAIEIIHKFAREEGGVLGGRMAHLLDDLKVLKKINKGTGKALKAPPVDFSIFLTAKPEVAGSRIYEREEIHKRTGTNKEEFESEQDAIEQTKARDEYDNRHFLERYGVDIHDPNKFNTVIDTTGHEPVETLWEILKAMKRHFNR